MLDLDLLRSFVSVVDAGGFTRAGERVHRTQSTVSQQIRRLEQTLGRELLHRNGKRVAPTEEGERLLSYARKILGLAAEARDVLARPAAEGVARLGISDDFAAYRLADMLSGFARSHPGMRLDVRCDLSVALRRSLERSELDLALLKREVGNGVAVAAWPERLHWVTSRRRPTDVRRDPVPLIVFEQGCLYRNRAIHSIEAAQRSWHVAYTSSSLAGIQAAVTAGLGISILPEIAILDGHLPFGPRHGFPPIGGTELALVVGSEPSPATRRLAAQLVEFCNLAVPRRSRGRRSPRSK
jgi:DNA-binding transcriptional LysR family regulator